MSPKRTLNTGFDNPMNSAPKVPPAISTVSRKSAVTAFWGLINL
jgi:hypothetical protein